MAQGEAIFRPSSKDDMHLTLTWKVLDVRLGHDRRHPACSTGRGLLSARVACSHSLNAGPLFLLQGHYQHVSVAEDPEAKDDPLTLSKRLIIKQSNGHEEVFEDLDEIIARFVLPMADLVKGITEHRVFKNEVDRAAVSAALSEEKAANAQRIPYSISPLADAPGRFLLGFVPGKTVRFQVRLPWEGATGHGSRGGAPLDWAGPRFVFLSLPAPRRVRASSAIRPVCSTLSPLPPTFLPALHRDAGRLSHGGATVPTH